MACVQTVTRTALEVRQTLLVVQHTNADHKQSLGSIVEVVDAVKDAVKGVAKGVADGAIVGGSSALTVTIVPTTLASGRCGVNVALDEINTCTERKRSKLRTAGETRRAAPPSGTTRKLARRLHVPNPRTNLASLPTLAEQTQPSPTAQVLQARS